MIHSIDMKGQRGVLLLESLIAILLFSIGILAVVGLQANAIKNVTQAKYRSDAAFLADQLVGQMWADRTNIAAYAYTSGAGAGNLAPWIAQVAALPLAATYPPQVSVTATAMVGPPTYTNYQVSVTVRWQLPEEFNATPRPAPHSHTTTATIPCC